MIHTNLEALVEPDKWKILEEKYFEYKKEDLPSGLLSSYLVQDQSEPRLWRIVTFWNSKEDMYAYRKNVETPAWFLVFNAAGAEPKLTISEVLSSKS